ncbi:MAG: site-specific DNA-methyltransferase [Mycoplasmatales bacterium]
MDNKLDMKSKDITGANIDVIAQLFPSCITEQNGKKVIDFEKLKLEFDDNISDDTKEKYELTWPGKREAIIEAKTPTTKTLVPLKEKSIDFDNTKNIYIEGDNLEVLKVLQESYLNKIKCIYIDPPYNTGSDFIYKDNFKKDSKQELIDSGQIDELGNKFVQNTETNGRYHSDWLNMMYPRLKLARNLLKEDGVIFISIDDNEYDNLKKLCDEIFGESNFLNNIAVEMSPSSGVKRSAKNRIFIKNKESILIYAKSRNNVNLDPIYNEWNSYDNHYSIFYDGKNYKPLKQIIEKEFPEYASITIDSYWYFEKIKNFIIVNSTKIFRTHDASKWAIEKYESGKRVECDDKVLYHVTNETSEEEIIFQTKNGTFNRIEPLAWNLKNGVIATLRGDLWENFDKDIGNISKEGKVSYPNGKKPKRLIKELLQCFVVDEDIVLDFFSGSATTAHSVFMLNSESFKNINFLLVQLDEDLIANLKTATGKSKKDIKSMINFLNFVQRPLFIPEIAYERIIRSASEIKIETNADIDYGFRVFKLSDSTLNDNYYAPKDMLQGQIDLLKNKFKDDVSQYDILTHIILDLGLTLDVNIKDLSNNNFIVEEDLLYVSLCDTFNDDIFNEIKKISPDKLVLSETSFSNDAELTNVIERFKNEMSDTTVCIF